MLNQTANQNNEAKTMSIEEFIEATKKHVESSEASIRILSDTEISVLAKVRYEKDKMRLSTYIASFTAEARYGELTRVFSVREEGSERSLVWMEIKSSDYDQIIRDFFKFASSEMDKKEHDIDIESRSNYRDFLFS